MATLMEPSFSASASRLPYSSSSVPTMADSLPSISFGFDDLRDRMAKFTNRFDNFIAEGRKRVLEERNHFRVNVAELEEDSKMKQRAIEILSQKSSTHAQNLSKEAAETDEMHAAIASITEARDERSAARDRLKAEIAAAEKKIAQRLEAQKAHAAKIDTQARFNGPELEFWMDYLCMRVEGAGVPDRLKFTFTHVDEKNWEKEAWFNLSTEEREYKVTMTNPKLETEKMDAVVERLNENRELGIFLKGMRELFVAGLKGV